jgi:hypothetical protein
LDGLELEEKLEGVGGGTQEFEGFLDEIHSLGLDLALLRCEAIEDRLPFSLTILVEDLLITKHDEWLDEADDLLDQRVDTFGIRYDALQGWTQERQEVLLDKHDSVQVIQSLDHVRHLVLDGFGLGYPTIVALVFDSLLSL